MTERRSRLELRTHIYPDHWSSDRSAGPAAGRGQMRQDRGPASSPTSLDLHGSAMCFPAGRLVSGPGTGLGGGTARAGHGLRAHGRTERTPGQSLRNCRARPRSGKRMLGVPSSAGADGSTLLPHRPSMATDSSGTPDNVAPCLAPVRSASPTCCTATSATHTSARHATSGKNGLVLIRSASIARIDLTDQASAPTSSAISALAS
jgi:hypothetical protein